MVDAEKLFGKVVQGTILTWKTDSGADIYFNYLGFEIKDNKLVMKGNPVARESF
jgi:hypothetical protein